MTLKPNAFKAATPRRGMIVGIDVGQKNLGVCVWDADAKRVERWCLWDTAGTWAREVFECLQQHATPEFLEGVTKVVIEHQPSKNPKMVRIMHYLEFFFVSKGLPVTLQDSKHKLLYAATTPWFPSDSTDREWTYTQRKKLAVQTVAAFVKDTEQPLRHVFESSKKKDDLADSLLHAMASHAFCRVQQPNKTKPKKKVVARAPTAKQRRTGLSASNVKYLLQDAKGDAEAMQHILKQDKQLQRALKKHFGSLDSYLASIAG